MRNINVVKYRKLLRELQFFCRKSKSNLWRFFDNPYDSNKHYLTDYERGYIAGQHKAYNEVLKKVGAMIDHAEHDWENMSCREEQNDTQRKF